MGFEAGGRQEQRVTRRRAGVVVRAFDLVVRVAARGRVAVVDGARHGQPAQGQAARVGRVREDRGGRFQVGGADGRPFHDHVGGGLPLEPAHAFVEVGVLPVLPEVVAQAAVGPGAHDQPALARQRVEPALGEFLAERPHVGQEVVAPQAVQGRADVAFVVEAAEPGLPRPPLADHLVDVATLAHPDGLRVSRIFFLHIEAPVEQGGDLLRPQGVDLVAPPGERGVARLAGHFLGRAQGGEVERAEAGYFAVPLGVERVVLLAVEQAVESAPACFVEADHPFHRPLDGRPDAFEEGVVRRAEVLAPCPQDHPGLRVEGDAAGLGAEPHRAVRVHGDTEIRDLAQVALEFGKEPGRTLRIMPDMGAGARAATDPFPRPEAAVVQTEAGGGLERICC